MSGHSKWSTIKRKKGALDQKRGKLFVFTEYKPLWTVIFSFLNNLVLLLCDLKSGSFNEKKTFFNPLPIIDFVQGGVFP